MVTYARYRLNVSVGIYILVRNHFWKTVLQAFGFSWERNSIVGSIRSRNGISSIRFMVEPTHDAPIPDPGRQSKLKGLDQFDC